MAFDTFHDEQNLYDFLRAKRGRLSPAVLQINTPEMLSIKRLETHTALPQCVSIHAIFFVTGLSTRRLIW